MAWEFYPFLSSLEFGLKFVFPLVCPYFLKKLRPDVRLFLKNDPVLGVLETIFDLPLIYA